MHLCKFLKTLSFMKLIEINIFYTKICMVFKFYIFKFMTQGVFILYNGSTSFKAACGARFIFYFLSPSKRYLDNGFQYP